MKSRRPGLDELFYNARRHRFDVPGLGIRSALSVGHFLEVLDELNRLRIEFISFRENIDTGGALGRAVVIIVGAIAELERFLITAVFVPARGGPHSKVSISAANGWK